MIEVKCKPYLTKEDERQFWTYLKGSNYKLGMLINFGSEKLEIKRRIYDKARDKKICDNPRIFPREARRRSASTTKGFTLIELVVVISIFAFILSFAAALFVFILQQQKRTLSQQELLNQTSYVVEYMGRALRMAIKDSDGSCLEATDINYAFTHSDAGIKFINNSDNDTCQEFFWDSSDQKLKESKNDGAPLSLISDKLQINYFKIKLSGESNSDEFQPRVTISMEVQVRGAADLKKQIQTTISQRNLDSQ